MSGQNYIILAILAATVALFIWGRFRHDIVALAALLAGVAAGVVPAAGAFDGFANSAVITVACVLVLSRSLQTSGAIDLITRRVIPAQAGRLGSMSAVLGLGAGLSSVMNNVGALALLMPLAVRMSGRLGTTPGRMLMPLAFATILGGMTTLIGTPPNLIVSGFRAQSEQGQGFAMFDFLPVGGAVAVLGLAFILVVGWRLVPARNPSRAEDFDPGIYLTEAVAEPEGRAVGMTLRQVEAVLKSADAQVVALIRNGVRMSAPHGGRRIFASDIVVLEADVKELHEGLDALGLTAEGLDAKSLAAPPAPVEDDARPAVEDEAPVLRELVVLPGADIIGRSATDLALRTSYHITLMAMSRRGRNTRDTRARMRNTRMKAGDVLLMQGQPEALGAFASEQGCVPLAEREISVPNRRKAMLAVGIMLAAIVLAALGVTSAPVAFTAGVVAAMVTGTIPLRSVYQSVDWPVVVLLGALFPVAAAMQTTGTADLIARFLMQTVAQGNAVVALVVILVITMTLSDVMNNAATAAVMCPIAIQTAAVLKASPDSFLMAVAVGASCAFLTPIGHQNNTLILGPGGFRFGDYWRLGVPLELLIILVSVPLLLVFWPF